MINEIKLSVDDKNLKTLMTILKSLKSELLINLEVNGKPSNTKPTRYQPKTDKIMKEEESGVNDSSGKYINPAAYKQRLKKK
jgi:hypothetical protein